MNLLDHARRYAADPGAWAWPHTPQFDPTDRWYARIGAAPDHEAWLLTWLPGQETGWHDHGGSAGAFVVVSGVLREDTAPAGVRVLRPGAGRQFGPRHVHRVRNDRLTPAVSIHVYAPALTTLTRYDMIDGRLWQRVVERAGADW